MKRILPLIFALFSLVANLYSQQYPVTIVPRVSAPAPVNFYNYADETSLNSPITVQIFLNDITVSNRQIRLRTYFEGGNIQFRSKDFVLGAENLYLEGGVPLTLRNQELAPYYKYENIEGINTATYAQTIPEGSYNFCFEVYDYLSGAKLSSKKCATVFIFKNEPPILNLPFNKANIEPQDFENIVFQWTPRHINVSNVEYEFALVEVWDNHIDPRTAFLSQAPIYETTTRTTTLVYGPDKPLLLPGKRYAWRVRAKALQGLEEIGLFKNQGYSEVFWFSRTAPCQIPEDVNAEAKGTSKINVFWNQDPTIHSEFIIAYREADKQDAHWFTKRTNSGWATIWGLKPGTTYEYKVKGKCAYQYSEYSDLQRVSTDIIQNEDANYQCGIVPDAVAISNREPHPGLNIGDQITAGDFKVTITEMQGQANGVISGKGFVAIPYLKFAKFGVTFSNILVNSSNQLAEGEIVTLYDPEFGEGASMTVDVDVNISEGVNGDNGVLEDSVTVDFIVDSIEIDANGAIVVTGTNGETAVIPGDDDVDIISSNGDVWSVGEDGTVTQQEGAEGGAVTDTNTNGLDSSGNVNSITASGVSVVFENSGYYHFDELPNGTSTKFEKEYKVLDKSGSKYKVAYKAISDTNGDDFINAKVTINDSDVKKEDLVFKTKDGAKIEVTSWNGDIAKLKLKRKYHYADEEIFAVIKNKDDKFDVAGSVILTHLASDKLETINITLVPVGISEVDSKVKEQVKDIYRKAGVRLNIQEVDEVSPEQIYGWDKDKDGRLKVGDSSVLSHYTDEEAVFNSYIKKQNYYSKKTYYVFVTNVPVNKSDVEGFMPLKRQFGFVFTANAKTVEKQTRTLAHELGHGVFGLQHTWDEYKFPQGATNSLMDYGNGTVLNHLDWKKMHAPGIKIYWFQGDEDGEHYVTQGYFKKLDFGQNTDEAKTFSFFTPSGQILILPNKVKEVTKYYGYYGTSLLNDIGKFDEFMSIVPGTILSFVIEDKKYMADIYDSNGGYKLRGYKASDGTFYKVESNGITPNEKNIHKAMLFGVEKLEETGYHILQMNTASGYSVFKNDSDVINILDFKYNYKNILKKKKLNISNSSIKLNQNSITEEGIKWTFIDSNYESQDNVFLIYNKILELKSLYPRFLTQISNNFGKWNKNNICNIGSLSTKYERKLLNKFCELQNKHYDFKDELVNELPKSKKEWGEDFYRFLNSNINDLANDVAKSIVEYNQLTPEDKVKEDKVNNIAKVINLASQNDIKQLNSSAVLRIISKFVNLNYTQESDYPSRDFEGAILKLIQNSNANIYKELLIGIEGKNKYSSEYLFEQMFKSVDDETSWLLFKTGSPNRLKLMGVLTEMMLNSKDFYDERLKEAYNNLGERVFILEYNNIYKSLGKTLLYDVAYGEHWNKNFKDKQSSYDIDYDWFSDDLEISIRQHKQYGWYETDTNPAIKLKPFDLVVFINNSNLSNVKGLMRNPRLTDVPLPSLSVVYSSDAASGETIDQSLSAVIDVASLLASGGAITAIKGATTMHKMRKAFLIADMASSGLSITATMVSDYEENDKTRKVLSSLSAITGIISMGDLTFIRNKSLKDRFNISKTYVDRVKDLPTKEKVEAVVETLHKFTAAEMEAFIKAYPDDADNALSIVIKYLKDAVNSNEASRIVEGKEVLKRMSSAAKSLNVSNDLSKINKLTTSKSIDLSMDNIDQMEVWFDLNDNVVKTSAKSFADEIPSSSNNLYDVTTKEGLYIKFDVNDGRILLGDTSGKYHAFGQVNPSDYEKIKIQFKNSEEAIKNYFLAKTSQLQRLSGLTKRRLKIGGTDIFLSENKVSTILGRFMPDIKGLFDDLGSFKNIGLGEVKGGVNLLNRPDNYYEPSTWWVKYNEPWLKKAIDRGDDIILATKPTKKTDLIDASGNLKGAFSQELKFLVDKNYKPKNISLNDWNKYKNWFKISKYESLGLTGLVSELEKLDEVTKLRFFDDFIDASEVTLKKLDTNVELITYWKFNSDLFRNKSYPNAPNIEWDIAKNKILENNDPHEVKILEGIIEQEKKQPLSNKKPVMSGAYSDILGNEVVVKYNLSTAEKKTFNFDELDPVIKEHIAYMNLIREDLLNGGKLYEKLYNAVPKNKLIAAGEAASHAEVLAMNEVIKKLREAGEFNSRQDLYKIKVLVKGKGNWGNMCRCPHCFHLTNGVKIIGNE
ncbi:Fibronectin type III domain-containing protein [Tenacibaculum sp. MAR_2010_89]|uniref:fibronectin type III domain-containing protein n=1 Tax=Tenacibaculum sp. MAR_2010_89 TaxID=1250198 RepID=UPI0008987EC8|nr:fibronectin type III domain-containing protein [Tenacibaculum sp. MAR_2010_89]SEE56461.1 Fibronectin type III domain-containing protein [Tenacibaculum sp. MAR_2010_89]